MLTIRLSRIGKRNNPQFRIVLQEKTQAATSAAREILGFYNPHQQQTAHVKKDRIQYWLSKGAKPSATMHNFFINFGLLTGKKMRVVGSKKKTAKTTPSASAAPALKTTKNETQATKA
ncbi:MAG: 30S ribosomal protein S16 [Candidatus Kerfeldbacteria bacterium RIFCSPHIGHO2_02_FULL_42_14]|uniref:Small ribosomal subunit protein bS16 n=1 Tax=Candidatus Kerfeldbacteria bacterium RIFCSPHIGHO2_02_FULL_42_14 TaxID=1798540 RepID=A0A1G2ASW8_9BACT|nr:MAG: 30S ribosomal protein S16 [Candidatus Kerfeldbacteria bacterium RIFCSPHIGHO2_02_FULL_42_14]OGY81381.1 MAG: 30S ribosomal protein S16 [Candidatus Kerfeldbacteria bacterium RIFCSPHIGHO2_12_FULL_42_13]OGY83231.1 MAG: 30S ribosomal protein S16 [Candidatus Kerfeldbacteria bacterium RIFCSPLOWO2_02_FULL_42_19]OGY85536.1 MAG: 30S ribosomal protein S16 [Candidatus Kerfeldbacteria bacterium RIFCSPLOWO2_12_FULL_43_9]